MLELLTIERWSSHSNGPNFSGLLTFTYILAPALSGPNSDPFFFGFALFGSVCIFLLDGVSDFKSSLLCHGASWIPVLSHTAVFSCLITS